MSPKKKTRPGVSRIKILIRRRANVLGSAGLIKSFDDNYQESEVSQVQVRISLLEDLWRQFSEIQDEIDMCEDPDSSELSEERISFHHMYMNLKSSLMSKLPREIPTAQPRATPNLHTSSITQGVRLPEIKIPEFYGNPEDWVEFRDLFRSLVHGNAQLTAVQKFHYLKAALKGEAHRIVSCLEVSAANYLIGWNLIERRYNNPNFLIKRHIAALFSIPVLKRESASALSELVDQFDRHVNILNQLEESEAHWNSVLVEGLSRRLDSVTLKEWEKQCKEDERPTYEQLVTFIRKQCRMLQSVKLSQTGQNSIENKQSVKPKPMSTYVVTEPSNKCIVCKQSHSLHICDRFKGMPPKERYNLAKKYKLCINCLKGYHMARDCNASCCSVCAQRHHTLLHLPPIADKVIPESNIQPPHAFITVAHPSPRKVEQIPIQFDHSSSQKNRESIVSRRSVPIPITFSSTRSCDKQFVDPPSLDSSHPSESAVHPLRAGCEVFLSTALVKVKDTFDFTHLARIVLDNCSQCNFVSESLALKLGLKRIKTNMDVVGIGPGKIHITEMLAIKIDSCVGNFSATISCPIIPKIPAVLPSMNVDISSWRLPENLRLADPKFNISAGVEILIGAELFYSLVKKEKHFLANGYPLLQNTVFGFVVSGMYSNPVNKPAICVISTGEALDALLQRFWESEQRNEERMLSPEEQQCENHFRRTVSRDEHGRYVVRLPLREDRLPMLGDSYPLALRRFLSVERRFNSNPGLRNEYLRFMDEYARLGHMEASSRIGKCHFFLPHHAIQRPDSSTTKTRVVFDATCKGGNQLSLNDVLYAGPIVQPSLLSIVLNFRMPRFVFIADIEKMFRQIWIHPDDRKLLKIVWRSNVNEPFQIFQLKTVTYGTSCAPFQATRVLNQLAADEGKQFPLGAKIVTSRTYVDDTLAGDDDLDRAIESTVQLNELLKRGGFNLRKWCANDTRVLCKISQALIEMPTEVEIDRSSSVKTLGLLWNPHSDQFRFKIPQYEDLKIITKRIVVSEMAQLFDPLGLVGSVIISAKIFVQHLWAEKYSWDQTLPERPSSWWLEYRNQISELQKLSVPRRVLYSVKYHLHCFCDASERGYGCCVYVVSFGESETVYSNLLITKSRVAPLRGISIPRLELCAALLGSQLVDQVLSSTDFKGPVTYWTDSTVVLQWINSPPSNWKVYVSNRVAEIQRLSKDNDWHHVPSELNPADKISRGIQPHKIIDDQLWWYGPPFILRESKYWPEKPIGNVAASILDVERRPAIALFSANQLVNDTEIFHRFSELSKLLKVVAYCLRFARNCTVPCNQRVFNSLCPSEINNALKSLIRFAQQQSFPFEISKLQNAVSNDCSPAELHFKSLLKGLNLFLDDYGLVRINGRLEKLSAPFDARCPILLPGDHRLTQMIARSIHLQTLHSGPTLLLATMRQRYWPIHGRNLARKIVRNCVQCFRCNPRSHHQIMAPLPEVRITPARVFSKCGLDYCGPFLVRPLVGRGSSVKVYVACFVCMSSKAIHLELAYDLSSEACINAIKRFIARRGRVSDIYCDNATTFIGADRELKEARLQYLEQFKTNQWENFCLDQGIAFHHIPARSPHFGGLWEAGIKSFKHHFRRVLGCRAFRLDEMSTAIVQIEGILNSRPLTPLSDNVEDLTALTPGHLLIDEPMFSLPEPELTKTNSNYLRRFQIKRSVQDFWNRWSRDYVSQLHQRPKWQSDAYPSLRLGTLVLLKQGNVPPLFWNLGRIVETFPSSDGRIRVVQIRTAKGLFKRAITEVCALPIDNPETSNTQLMATVHPGTDQHPTADHDAKPQQAEPNNKFEKQTSI